MNIFGKTLLVFLFLPAIMLASCSSSRSTPTMSDAEIMETAMATVGTTLAETQRAIPTNTPLPTVTLTPTASATPSRTFVPSPTGTPIFPPIESFVGRWQNTDSNSEGWSRILIANNEGTLSAHYQVLCTLTEEERLLHYPDELICDEDIVSARYGGNPILLFREHESSTTNFTFSLNGDILHVTTLIHFTDNSGRADKTLWEADFRKLVPSFPVSEEIVFYHFVVGPLFHRPVPGGSVYMEAPSDMGGVYLFPASSDEPSTSDTAADLRIALELVLQHEANPWISSDLEIVDVAFRDGHADIVLQGEYSGESDEVLSIASMQILLTVFANPAVQSAAVTLNGDTIGNLGVSSSTNAKPADYRYMRTEMETYLIEHAFIVWP